MRTIESVFFNRGYVRCPNHPTRWYASGPNILEPINADVHIVYIPEHAPEGRIIVVPKFETAKYPFSNAIVMFRDTFEFDPWLEENGQLSQSGQGSNSWD